MFSSGVSSTVVLVVDWAAAVHPAASPYAQFSFSALWLSATGLDFFIVLCTRYYYGGKNCHIKRYQLRYQLLTAHGARSLPAEMDPGTTGLMLSTV